MFPVFSNENSESRIKSKTHESFVEKNKENFAQLNQSKKHKKLIEIVRNQRTLPLNTILLNPQVNDTNYKRYIKEPIHKNVWIRNRSRPVSVERDRRDDSCNIDTRKSSDSGILKMRKIMNQKELKSYCVFN